MKKNYYVVPTNNSKERLLVPCDAVKFIAQSDKGYWSFHIGDNMGIKVMAGVQISIVERDEFDVVDMINHNQVSVEQDKQYDKEFEQRQAMEDDPDMPDAVRQLIRSLRREGKHVIAVRHDLDEDGETKKKDVH